MRIDITRVSPIFPVSVFVQWQYVPDPNVSGDFKFVVERSGSPEGPWTNVSGDLLDTVNFTDSVEVPDKTSDETNLLSLQRSVYYRVTVTDPRNNTATSPAVDLDGAIAGDTKQQTRVTGTNLNKRVILLRRKILRDEGIAFRALTGIEARVLKRRHFGARCTLCYDPLTRSVTRSNCPTCFGTSWTGGYFPAISTFCKIAPSPVQASITNEGKSEIRSTQLTLLNYPKVEEGDVIVEVNGDSRWLVKQVSPTELRRIVVHQRILVVELPRGAPEYKIAV